MARRPFQRLPALHLEEKNACHSYLGSGADLTPEFGTRVAGEQPPAGVQQCHIFAPQTSWPPSPDKKPPVHGDHRVLHLQGPQPLPASKSTFLPCAEVCFTFPFPRGRPTANLPMGASPSRVQNKDRLCPRPPAACLSLACPAGGPASGQGKPGIPPQGWSFSPLATLA